MLKAEEQMELAVLKKHGGSIRGLSRLTGRSRNTIRRYLRGGEEVAKRKPGPKRAEKLDPFKSYIVDRMKAALPTASHLNAPARCRLLALRAHLRSARSDETCQKRHRCHSVTLSASAISLSGKGGRAFCRA